MPNYDNHSTSNILIIGGGLAGLFCALKLAPRPVMTLYMGDDWTDEHAFEALEGQAITIKIGGAAPASRAQYRLPDVEAAQRLVGGLATLIPASGVA